MTQANNDLLQALADIDRIVLLQVQDERYAQEAVQGCAEQLGCSWTTWDLGSDGAEEDPLQSLNQYIDTHSGDWILSFDLADRISDPVFARQLIQRSKASDGPVLIIAVDGPRPAPALQPYVRFVKLPVPSIEDTIQRVIRGLKNTGWKEPKKDKELPVRLARLVRMMHGLSLTRLDRTVQRLANQDPMLGEKAQELVQQARREQLHDLEFLEMIENTPSENQIGGLEVLQEWLHRRRRATQLGVLQRTVPPPRGMLLVGVPGCGKSLAAQVSASVFQVPLLRLEFGRLRGNTEGPERRLLRCLAEADKAAPCVLWLDEIDHALGTVATHQENQGLVGTLTSWLQEHETEVFVAATANRVEMLPPELVRKGRFDEIFFVDLPNRTERADILRVHLRAVEEDATSIDVDKLAESTAQYTGAELEAIVREAKIEATLSSSALTTEVIMDVVSQIVPLVRTHEKEIRHLREWATYRARSASTDTGVLAFFDSNDE
ncbi:MAG: hypothetical protein CMH54_01165 [Myxococcales bacterium]|nr:hypothetical protein [Myxococcales bacterium]|tara:strand:+ start:1235 stop:2710 length:1476 start_codon:yes stop_codon:yes gene_type:complete